MAQFNLGQAAIVGKGAWDPNVTYSPLNAVTHNGGSFMAIAENSSVEPGVTTGWASYWVRMTMGIKSVTFDGLTNTKGVCIVTFSDGTVYTSPEFNTTPVADGEVTAAKLGSDILPANVGIKYGSSVPTTSDITPGQIYLKYES